MKYAVLILGLILSLGFIFSSCLPDTKEERKNSWEANNTSCIGGIRYYVGAYSLTPVFQKDTIPKLVLCE